MLPTVRLSLLLCLFLSIPPLFSQSETGKAAIGGQVLDASGQSIKGATVAALESQTGFRRNVVTDNEGKFRFNALPVGTYELVASATGFGSVKAPGIPALVGETRTVNLTLNVANVSTEIKVEDKVSLVNDADTNNSTIIGQRAIEELPIRARNFTEFFQLAPNVTQEQNRFGLVVNGQRSINSNISIDGVDFNDSLQGGQRGGGANESAYFFPQLAVREFQMVRDGASAEVGRTNSGYLNVVTKSGTNTIHGEGFYLNRNGAMTSQDAFGNDSSNNSQHQIGGSLGGPIKRDKLFFFGAVEKNLLTIPYTVKFNPPTGGVAIPQDIASQQGTFSQKNNPLVAFGKIDYVINERNLFNLQYTYAAQYGLNFGGVSGQTTAASTNNTILDRASQGVKMALTTVLSSNLINEVRGQYAFDNRQQVPNSTLAEITINDLGTLGGSKNGTYIYEATRWQVLDNVTWTKGRHTIKAGIDMNFNPQRQQRETNYGGTYVFTTLGNYLAALAGDKTKIAQFSQSIAANGTQGLYEGAQQDMAAFITDTFRIRRDLTITAGLRWEGQLNPQPNDPNPKYPFTGYIPHDLKMWQPRLGLAWNIGGKSTSVLRVSAGLFDSRTPAYLMQRVFTDNGLNTLVLDSATDPSILNYITVPNKIDKLPAGVKTPINSIYAFDPNFRNPRSGQIAVAFEQQIDRATKVTVGFVRNSTWSLQRRIDTNLFEPVTLSNGFVAYPSYDSANKLIAASGYNEATGQGIYIDSVTGRSFTPKVSRPDPTVGQINFNKSVSHSDYNGGYVSIQRRMSKRLQFGFNYTYARSRDDDSNERDFNRQPAYNTYNLKADGTYAKNDIRHSGNFNGLYDLGRGFVISTLLFARTGIPVKPVIGADLQNDGNTVNDRPVINGVLADRAAFRQPGVFDWDMRLLKTFVIKEKMKLIFTIEGFNLTRSSNKTFNGDGESTFGRPQATVNPRTGLPFANNTALIPTLSPGTDRFGGPRQGQIGARFVF